MNAIYDQHYNPLLDHGHKQGGRTITTLVLLRYSVSVDARARWSASARRTRAFTRAISYVLSSVGCALYGGVGPGALMYAQFAAALTG